MVIYMLKTHLLVLVENLQYLEGEKLGLDPRVDRNQIKLLEEKIDLVRTEILEIEIQQRGIGE